jgi:hypothetical protein
MIEYAQGYDEVDAALSIIDTAPARYPKMKIQDIRELCLQNDLQFIGIMIDTFIVKEYKINVTKKVEVKTGERNEISKGSKRSNHKKSRQRQKTR